MKKICALIASFLLLTAIVAACPFAYAADSVSFADTSTIAGWGDHAKGRYSGTGPEGKDAILGYSSDQIRVDYRNDTGADMTQLNDVGNAVLGFWMYLSETDFLKSNASQIELNSSGSFDDANEYHWDLNEENFYSKFTAGEWNYVELKIPAAEGFNDLCDAAYSGADSSADTGWATRKGDVNNSSLNFFRFYNLFTYSMSAGKNLIILFADLRLYETAADGWEDSLIRITKTETPASVPTTDDILAEQNVQTDTFSNFYDDSTAASGIFPPAEQDKTLPALPEIPSENGAMAGVIVASVACGVCLVACAASTVLFVRKKKGGLKK